MPFFRLLAIDTDVVIGLLFGLISIGAAIVNAMNSKKEPPRKKAGGRPKDAKVRDEIEAFLEQQGGGRKSAPIELGPDDIELVEEAPRRRPSPVVQPARKPKPAQKPVVPAPRAATPRPAKPAPRASALPTQVTKRGQTAATETSDFGGGLREHVKTAMAERVANQAQRDLPHLKSSVDQRVREDLGAPDTTTFSVSGKGDAAGSGLSPLVLMLQNPKTARQAVLMSEIMGRPKALRK